MYSLKGIRKPSSRQPPPLCSVAFRKPHHWFNEWSESSKLLSFALSFMDLSDLTLWEYSELQWKHDAIFSVFRKGSRRSLLRS